MVSTNFLTGERNVEGKGLEWWPDVAPDHRTVPSRSATRDLALSGHAHDRQMPPIVGPVR